MSNFATSPNLAFSELKINLSFKKIFSAKNRWWLFAVLLQIHCFCLYMCVCVCVCVCACVCAAGLSAGECWFVQTHATTFGFSLLETLGWSPGHPPQLCLIQIHAGWCFLQVPFLHHGPPALPLRHHLASADSMPESWMPFSSESFYKSPSLTILSQERHTTLLRVFPVQQATGNSVCTAFWPLSSISRANITSREADSHRYRPESFQACLWEFRRDAFKRF